MLSMNPPLDGESRPPWRSVDGRGGVTCVWEMSMERLLETLINLVGCIWTFANTTFATALIGSLAGAFAGAYGAQRIAERSKTKELLLAEIRNTNAAIMVASVVFSFFMARKSST